MSIEDMAKKALNKVDLSPENLTAVGKDIVEYAKPQLKELGQGLLASFQDRFSKFVDAGDLDRFKELTQEALDNEQKALLTENADHARQYAQAAKSNIRSIETLTLAAEVAKDAQTASMLMEAFDAVLSTFKGMAGGVLKIVVSGGVKGAGGSLGGGGGDIGDSLKGGLSEFGGLFG